jgi:hypothetical protein
VSQPSFEPRAILAQLERNYVDYVVIGGLARVVRGADEPTAGVDICPSFAPGNLDRLSAALTELNARGPGANAPTLTDEVLGAKSVIALFTDAGPLNVVPSPAGALNGFVDLRRSATKEHLGHGLRPMVAATGDLARMAAALGDERNVARRRELRRIMELELDRGQALASPAESARRPSRGAAQRGRSVTH